LIPPVFFSFGPQEEERKFHASLEAQCVKRERAVRIAQEQETAVLRRRGVYPTD